MAKGTQGKLGKIRPPRVQITYDVETGDATKQKSLPFVVGVVADLAPSAANKHPKLRDREFTEVSSDNFDRVMSALSPTVSLKVSNKLGGESATMQVDLTFKEMDAFAPAGVAAAVPQLAKLLETREKLNDLLAKLEGNERLNDLLAEVVLNTEVQHKAIAESPREPREPRRDAPDAESLLR